MTGLSSDRPRRRLRLVESTPAADRVEATYRAHGDRLWRSVRAYCGDDAVASDAVAEAFAQLLRRGDEVRDPAAWVWRVAFRIAAGDLQARRRDLSGELAEVRVVSEGPDPEVLDVLRALGALSPLQRAAVVLHDYAGFRAREAAEIMGSTEAAVRVHLMRGRRRLRTLLS